MPTPDEYAALHAAVDREAQSYLNAADDLYTNVKTHVNPNNAVALPAIAMFINDRLDNIRDGHDVTDSQKLWIAINTLAAMTLRRLQPPPTFGETP